MFSKVLVANRGEIAVRIIRSLRELGIKTVAIYSTADRESLHIQLADEAVCVGTARAQDSYLNAKNILEAALGTGAQAIHPGFGFLSENAEFATMCEECGITFIGPQASVIDLIGNKEHAREQMKKSGVPVIPGSDDYITNVNDAVEVANKIGYPILLKAAAGGGGKGIRRINDHNQMRQIFSEAQNEARLSFNDDRMYLEKIMENVKHIEVQVFRDNFGNAVFFPERDCSIQRNKQKLIEESPCVLVNEQERKKLGQIAMRAINAINYHNTGTINYLYLPVGNLGMRIDTAIYPGSKITPYYDSMIAKVIALGQDYQEAIEKIKQLLNEMVIMGVTTNQNFHLAILNNSKFLAGTASTTFLEDSFLPQWKKELTA